MNNQEFFTVDLSEYQLDYLQTFMPQFYSFVKVPNHSKEKQKIVQESPIINTQKRPRKCPIDPHYEVDYQFYKNKKNIQQTSTNKTNTPTQKEINSYRTLMENLKKHLLTVKIQGKNVIEAEIDQIQNKLRKSAYTSIKQFITQVKQRWKKLLASYSKQDPMHKACASMEEYWRYLLSNLNAKKNTTSSHIEKSRHQKKMTPQEKYLLNKTNKRSHPDLNYEKTEAISKRKPISISTFNQNLGEQKTLLPSKTSNSHSEVDRTNQTCPQPTEASLAISPAND